MRDMPKYVRGKHNKSDDEYGRCKQDSLANQVMVRVHRQVSSHRELLSLLGVHRSIHNAGLVGKYIPSWS